MGRFLFLISMMGRICYLGFVQFSLLGGLNVGFWLTFDQLVTFAQVNVNLFVLVSSFI